MNIYKLGSICKHYRMNIMGISLNEMSTKTNTPLKNISAFENGRANNIKYIKLYYNLLESEELQAKFLNDVWEVM